MVRGASVNPGVCLFSQDKLVGGRRNHLVRGRRKPRVCAFPNNAPLLPQIFIWAVRFFFSSSVEGTTQKSPHVWLRGRHRRVPRFLCFVLFVAFCVFGLDLFRDDTYEVPHFGPWHGTPAVRQSAAVGCLYFWTWFVGDDTYKSPIGLGKTMFAMRSWPWSVGPFVANVAKAPRVVDSALPVSP